ncbi:SMP-30/gluconolactonase/LRE family protein [Cumulibacter manganitolerans]|uniref:SMP-30/gluconolactonase/LRE family protein n=1 Tax=Cumulibacter manganitolerans TaxID=1884992 RepID=UPI001294DE56|nr:SMP-30/gluconolactonase/LRE family protein [Cumulibacter manganitolerans]
MLKQIADGFTFLEGPRWHDGKLYVSDFYSGRVLTVTDDGQVSEVLRLDDRPSGMGWMPDGSMLLVAMTARQVLRVRDGEVSVHADLSALAPGLLNDMVVDADGRAYVGNFGFDMFAGESFRTAAVVVVQPDGAAHVAADGLYFPNGSMITPDGRTLIVNESYGNRISAFDIGPDGLLGERRDWAVFGPQPSPGADVAAIAAVRTVAPDGGCLDASGAVWLADAAGARLMRVAEGAEVLEEIHWDGGKLFACMLGGADGRTLYACGAPDSSAQKRAAAREAVLLSARVEVPRAGLP